MRRPLFCFLALAGAFLACTTPRLRAESPVPPASTREVIQKSLRYLTYGGEDWMEDRKCASCHHAPMTIWSLEMARQHGYEIDTSLLKRVAKWSVDPKRQVLAPPPAKKEPWSDKVQPAVAYFKLATDHAAAPLVSDQYRASLVEHLVHAQEPDGSWQSYVAHPPMLDSGETSTLYVLVALLGKEGPPVVADWPDRQARAFAYLGKAALTTELQPRLWRIALRQALGAGATGLPGSSEEDRRAVLAAQRADGGWGQNPDRPSDAYITGQILYFLAEAGCPPESAALKRAVSFLAATQKEDGSWPMGSRDRTAPKAGPGAGNLDIIGYAATAWAAMGLIATGG